MEKDPHHRNSKRYAKQARKVAKLVKRILNDPYWEIADREATKRYGKLRHYSARLDAKDSVGRLLFLRDKQDFKNYEQVEAYERKLDRNMNRLRERDWKRIWSSLEKNLRGWWC